MFYKLLVPARGENALRIIRACKDLNIKTVAVYSTADRNAIHLRFADQAVCIGPPPLSNSYRNPSAIVSAAEITGTDTIINCNNPLFESTEFLELCEKFQKEIIGLDRETIEKVQNKLGFKKFLIKNGIHTVPGTDGIVDNLDEAKRFIKKIGYPIAIKRLNSEDKRLIVAHTEESFEDLWNATFQQLKENQSIYLEKYFEECINIEIITFADAYGNVVYLSEIDTSVQHQNQKIIVETPSPNISDDIQRKIRESAIKIARILNYKGICTIKFFVDKKRNFYFKDLNFYGHFEHSLCEEVTPYDLIKDPIELLIGKKFVYPRNYPQFYSIECQVHAQDIDNNFCISPGKIDFIHFPQGKGIRIDTHVYSGYTILPFYDTLVARVICTAMSRNEAIAKMISTLTEFEIEGISTNIQYLLKILQSPAYKLGEYNINTTFGR